MSDLLHEIFQDVTGLIQHPEFGPIYAPVKHFDDGMFAYVCPITFGRARLQYGNISWVERGYCYDDPVVAVAALEAWNGIGDPDGWMRCATDGRRRPGGDPAKEFVRE